VNLVSVSDLSPVPVAQNPIQHEPSPDQAEVISQVMTWVNRGSRTKQILTFGGYAGCLSGDTMLAYNRGARANTRPITLRDLYLKFNGQAVPGVRGASARFIDLTLPTYLESMWPDGTVALNRVVGVLQSGVKKVLRVTFDDGASLTLTEDHPVAIPGGDFLAAGSLVVGDHVLGRGSMRPAGEGQGKRHWSQSPPRVIVNTKYHPGPAKTVTCNGIEYEYVRVARARLVVEAAMNGIEYDEFVHALKHNESASAGFKYLPLGNAVNVHHVDEDTLNDDITNLQVLPHEEHARIHTQERNDTTEYLRERVVVSVAPAGEEMTYDVQMEPPANNFVANGIIVHNTGKTFVVSLLAKQLLAPLAFCAYTGKASSVLARKLGEAGIATTSKPVRAPYPGGPKPFEPRPYCGTIHGLVFRLCDVCMREEEYPHTYGPGCKESGEAPEGVAVVETGEKCLGCYPPPPKPLLNPCPRCQNARYIRRDRLDRDYSLIIADEASMISDELLGDLKSFGVPILAVGDHGQLPPVGENKSTLMVRPDVRLEKIHRQSADNPIILLSARIRETGEIDTKLADGDRFQVASLRDLGKLVASRFTPERFAACDGSILSTGLIVATNRLRVGLNDQARSSIGTKGGAPKKGEVVICLKNQAPIYNGMRAVLTADSFDLSDDKMAADMNFVEDGITTTATSMFVPQFNEEKTLDVEALRALGTSYSRAGGLFDFGYSMTCHKAQGSQFPEAVVVADNLGWLRENRARWIYTAVTRAAQRLVVVR
jgi:exodeoxyribonuclease V